MSSDFISEAIKRGMLYQCTNLEGLKSFLQQNKQEDKKIYAYLGFDCTHHSLHVGHLLPIMFMKLAMSYNIHPIILIGSATSLIGDPSGKDKTRQILSHRGIENNTQSLKKLLIKFFPEDSSKITYVNNIDWWKHKNYIEVLRDIGSAFSVNKMLKFDSIAMRLNREQHLSFLEFNYQIFQAYDFVYLKDKYNCTLQLSGADQWGNMVSGIELYQKLHNNNTEKIENNSTMRTKNNSTMKTENKSNEYNSLELFGATCPILTTNDGKKMGKSQSGAIWLDESLLSTFDYYQFWRNTPDIEVDKYLYLFTELSTTEIDNLISDKTDINKKKEILAFETTKILHGLDQAIESKKTAQQLFSKLNAKDIIENSDNNSNNTIPKHYVKLNEFLKLNLTKLIVKCKLCSSSSEAKRLIKSNAVKLNDEIILDINFSSEAIKNKFGTKFLLTIGKKKKFLIEIQ